ncbi:MAG TPA: efflux RND transporter periplasmic adaptor subunit [candidate division Zixibacteria bacterium]
MNAESSGPDLSRLRIHRDEGTPVHAVVNRNPWKFAVIATVVLAVIVTVLFLQLRGGVAVVEVASVQRLAPAAAQSLLTATGYVVAQRQAAVASKGTGRLEVLNVEEGDQVKSGDVIGRLESNDVEAALASARASVAQADAEWERARALLHEAELNYDRIKGLLTSSLASQSEFDNAEAQFRTAQAGVNSAKAALDRAHADQDYAAVAVENTLIRAPFDGTVLTKDADVGEVVAPFAASSSSRGALVTLADMSSLEVEADVSESNIQRVSVGQPCIITLDAQPAEPYAGYVKKIVPTADRSKATVLTKIAFDQLDSRVLPEMSAKVGFLASGQSAAELGTGTVLTVPTTTLTTKNGQTLVFRVSHNRVSEVTVQTGRIHGGVTEIVSGLDAGDIVVVNPPHNLHDGDDIELKE